MRCFLFWTPCIVGGFFALFINLFALNIFDVKLGFWGTIAGLFMYLILSILLATTIALAWLGMDRGLIFAGWSVFYAATARGFHWSVYMIIPGIPSVIGILFLLDCSYRKDIRTA